MNEEDLMIQEKIKKREKTDIMLAYILIVILLGCIIFIVYLKFIKNESTTNDNNNGNISEYTVNYISLGDIASSLNSNLMAKYNGINASTSADGINISYGDLLYDIKLVNNELEFKMDNDNKELSEDIYKEIITSICTYYSNDRDGCKNASGAITYGNNETGIRFVNDTMFISTTNGISPMDVIEKKIYAKETITDIDNTEYEINMNNKIISNIKVDLLDTNIVVSGTISNNGKITVKLYDANDVVLDSKELEKENNFSISFDYNDKLDIDSVKKYSISIE